MIICQNTTIIGRSCLRYNLLYADESCDDASDDNSDDDKLLVMMIVVTVMMINC